mmetsp:Transcript_45084/g.124964  ORF Transcript_45084/g.124964 Transcript_45084/m.124964 type:complete len:275 (+) Transcript_45084:49-873(+)
MPFLGFGGGRNPLEAALRKVTDTDLIDVPPKDVMLGIVQASFSADDRREIMRHLNACLSETSSGRWRRVHGGLVLLEQLLQRGARALVAETAEGHHFDLVQRLTFLQRFSFGSDQRVQLMVRQKATALRAGVLSRMEEAGPLEGLGAADWRCDAQLGDNFASSSASKWRQQKKGSVIVNDIVCVGHRDDTDTESGSDAEAPRKSAGPSQIAAVEGRRHQRRYERRNLDELRRKALEESTDTDSSGGERLRKQDAEKHAKVPLSPLVQTVNLLDM